MGRRYPPKQEAELILRLLVRRHTYWRERVGDSDYERSIAYWQHLIESDGEREMTSMEELERRVAALEERLGIQHPEPLDRLSSIDFRLDSLRTMMQQHGLSIGELARTVSRVESRLEEHSTLIQALATTQGEHTQSLGELKAGQATIVAMLTTLIERGESA